VEMAGRHSQAVPPEHGGNLTENDIMNIPPEAALAALRREFPRYRIWLEPGHGGCRFVACRQHPGTGPHTLITSDPAELRATLTSPQQPGPDLPHPSTMPDTPQDTGAGDPHQPRGAGVSRPA
jgi:hypothetical protein